MEVLSNGIRVNGNGFHELRTKDRDPDYRMACVRDYVLAHKGEVMKLTDFGKAAYGSETAGIASPLIKKLLKNGRLTRSKVKDGNKGVSYTYLWHETRHVVPRINSSGPTTTRSLDLPEIDFTDDVLKKIDEVLYRFTTLDGNMYEGRNIAGAVLFRNWLNKKHKQQITAREAKLNER